MGKEIKQIIKKLGMNKNIGSSINKGWAYHGLPFDDIDLPIHRKALDKRVKLILSHYDIIEKSGIDLGCNIGGFVFSCQLKGAKMIGYDYDSQSIEFAKKIEKIKKTGAIFYNKSITEDILNDFDKIDFCLWLSQFMWLVKSIGKERSLSFMYELSKKINDVMFFETSFQDSMAGKEMIKMGIKDKDSVRNLLINNTCFTKIKYIGHFEDGWSKRPVFKCSNPKLEWNGVTAKVERISKKIVKKKIGEGGLEGFKFLDCKDYEIKSLFTLCSKHFPMLLSISQNSLDMEYCGIPLTKDNMPVDYEDQIKAILVELRQAKIVHRDIRPDNLLVKDNIIKLIDFGWAIEKGKENEKYPGGLGWKFKAKGEFDDEYSLRKSIDFIQTHATPTATQGRKDKK